ncbi:hypothetical protein GGS23DRAFT_460386 [Durotheca rogersii]|uniref:uncharacterized protein n=1 Tax=Durotheca rogersii TaxID=419775 RepID=UPI00221FB651|nr:uncharacterized protein GGS23DRAFT_460386 [Durotheca rogersii]KAI5864723.1 hypothetical protein GGS23DRAFT_460386 [Durotheca rogersii]
MFLLHLALVRRIEELDVQLIVILATILSLVIETVILRENLANSGTSLLWRIVYYGLAAAGIICISLARQSLKVASREVSISKVIQDLSVLVVEVDAGALVQPGDPNYALLTGPTKTIKAVLDKLMSNALLENPVDQQTTEPSAGFSSASNNDGCWNDWDNFQPQDFESDFWINLAGHPFLHGTENYRQDSV